MALPAYTQSRCTAVIIRKTGKAVPMKKGRLSVSALLGAEPAGGTPAALAAYHSADCDKWAAVIAKAGIMVN